MRDSGRLPLAKRYNRSRRRYLFACFALLVLLVATSLIAQLHLGAGNLVASMAIAVCKTAIVVWIFMDMGASSPLLRLVAAAGVAALIALSCLSLLDFASRDVEPTPWQQPQQIAPAIQQKHSQTRP
jgi:caa(3)-type oxidase subunit IV